MLKVDKSRNILEYDGNFFAYTSFDEPCPYLYAEFINGVWEVPKDSCDSWEAKVVSWEEFVKRTSTR